MDLTAIRDYHATVDQIIRHGGSRNETTVRSAFIRLINRYAQPKGLVLVEELAYKTKTGRSVNPDGTLKDKLRQDWGYYEAKDSKDDLPTEVAKKFAAGYPQDNILFEDSQQAFLYQQGVLTMRCELTDELALAALLNTFVSFERPEVKTFREALQHFSADVPQVTDTLRTLIAEQEAPQANPRFIHARDAFWELCKESINPAITLEDVREMMIQHVLTADIFNTVFDEPHFHRENNVAKELEGVVGTFFTGDVRRDTLGRIQHYYQTINAAAAQIADHHEKQRFLKVLYETFYKSYNPKAADRLGVVYTPNEIVRFMVEGTDWLLEKHFGRRLEDKGVEILDPATGTGTYICEIIDYLGQTEAGRKKLPYKYAEELHANEVAILPYYIANLNIEFTYKQCVGEYREFKNLCFVDTLDNVDFDFVGKQKDLFGSVSAENAERIRRQNKRKISVIIGNPPYNAKQENYNYQNANRGYKHVDKRIKETFIKHGTAQNQIVVYDMYTRFYRWAMDRLDDKQGVIAFITNRSFIDGRAFDGFRKVIEQDFQYAYIIDTQSDVRANPKISGTGHNVFGIQTGVAIMFLVKAPSYNSNNNCRIEYTQLDDFLPRSEKISWFGNNRLSKTVTSLIESNKKRDWIKQSDGEWEKFIPIASQEAKKVGVNAVFSLFSRGVATQRDEWVYDENTDKLGNKINYFIDTYNRAVDGSGKIDNDIKWDRELMSYLKAGITKTLEPANLISSMFRPYVKKYMYYDKHLNGMTYLWKQIGLNNTIIQLNGIGMEGKAFGAIGLYGMADVQNMPNGQCLPLYRYDKDGNRYDNITDWALEQFEKAYGREGAFVKREKTPEQWEALKKSFVANAEEQLGRKATWEELVNHPDFEIEAIYLGSGGEPMEGGFELTKLDIFHYVYAVLHDPVYREKYALNLKREFPRIPFYPGFQQWAAWGAYLMYIHINYETAKPYALREVTLAQADPDNPERDKLLAKAKLTADKVAGTITLDGFTRLEGIPPEAWDYKLGNRSALEWVLDQYKEKTPKDPTIREKFNTYRFADYKSHVIGLLRRVCRVSAETQAIIAQMQSLPADAREAYAASAEAA